MIPLLLLLQATAQQYPISHPHRSLVIPLVRKGLSPSEKRDLILSLHAMHIPSYPSFLSSSHSSIHLRSYYNTEYTGLVDIGTPPQSLEVIFDTGSGNFFVNSRLCQDDTCKSRKAYDHEGSHTYTKVGGEIEVSFASGQLTGVISQDTVTIAGISLQGQHFAEVTDENGEVFETSKFSGILGLGFSPLAAKETVSLFDNIVRSGELDWNVFSFYYSLDPEEESELIVGDVNQDKFVGELHWVPLVEEPWYWTVELTDVRLGERSFGFCRDGCKATLDTGTAMLSAPSADLDVLFGMLDKNCGEFLEYEDIVYVIDSREYRIPSRDYIITIDSDGEDPAGVHSPGFTECTLAFMAIDLDPPQGPMWVLGDIFLSNYYTVFDRDSMSLGFAKAIHN